jgi:uncharacterized protein involved in exopolysaccharide biosynthesis
MAISRNWKWLLLTPVILGAATMFTVASFTPKQYKAEAIIQIVPPQVPTDFVRPTVTSRLEDRIASISASVQSRVRLERVIQELNLYPERRQAGAMEDAVDRMRRAISVTVHADTFAVSFVDDRAKTAAQVANKLASAYIDESLRDRERLAQGTRQFMEGEVDALRQRLIAMSAKEKSGIPPAESWPFALEKEMLAAKYKSLLSMREDAALSATLEQRQIGEQFKLLEQARVPEQPIAPNRTNMTVGGALIGFGVGLVLLLVTAFRRSAP